jgi:hypothetical protein
MYRSWSALWEGWTNNLYLGANRSWGMMVYMTAIMLFLYHLQWLTLGILLANGDFAEILAISNYQLPITNYQLPIANDFVNYLFIRNRNLAALQFAPLGCRDF